MDLLLTLLKKCQAEQSSSPSPLQRRRAARFPISYSCRELLQQARNAIALPCPFFLATDRRALQNPHLSITLTLSSAHIAPPSSIRSPLPAQSTQPFFPILPHPSTYRSHAALPMLATPRLLHTPNTHQAKQARTLVLAKLETPWRR